MQKSGFYIIIIGCSMILLLVGLSNTIAYNRRSTDPDMIIFNRAMKIGMQAFLRQDYTEASKFLRRAVQVQPESSQAWKTFEKAIRLDQADRMKSLISDDTANQEWIRADINGNLCPCAKPISTQQHHSLKPEDFPANEDDGC